MSDTKTLRMFETDARASLVARAIPLVLADLAHIALVREANGERAAWRVINKSDERPIARLQLDPVSQARSHLLLAPDDQVRHVDLAEFEAELVARLEEYGIGVRDLTPPSSEEDETERMVTPSVVGERVALFAAPIRRRYEALAVRLQPLLEAHGFTLRLGLKASATTSPTLLIADVGTADGQQAVREAPPNIPMLLIAAEEIPLPEPWGAQTLRYGDDLNPFLSAFEQALLEIVQHPAPPSAIPDERAPESSSSLLEDLEPAIQPRYPKQPSPSEKQQEIYRRRALDEQAAPEARLHAAHLLARIGDIEGAAIAYGALAERYLDTEMARPVLDALAELGAQALPILWKLEAGEHDPRRQILLATYIAAAGDAETARLRLEALSRHPDATIARAAFDTLITFGLLQGKMLHALVHTSRDPFIRLAIVRWLTERALHDDLAIAEEALQEVRRLDMQVAHLALLRIMEESPHTRLRFLAAQTLLPSNVPSHVDRARETLLALALNDDEYALDAAHVIAPVLTPAEYERLMREAALPAVRQIAAEMLATSSVPETVRQQAIRTLLELEAVEQVLPALADLLHHAEMPRWRLWALSLLHEIGAPALPILRTALQSEHDPEMRLRIAETLLYLSDRFGERRQLATWLLTHGEPEQAADALALLATAPDVPAEEAEAAVAALIATYQTKREVRAIVVAALERIVRHGATPHLRRMAHRFLLMERPSALPLDLLVQGLIVADTVPSDLQIALQTLHDVAPLAAQHIADRILTPRTPRLSRWRLFTLLATLPPESAVVGLERLIGGAPNEAIALVAAEHLLRLGEEQTALSALATLAQNAEHANVRTRALYQLAMVRPQSDTLIEHVRTQTRYADARRLATTILYGPPPETWLERLWVALERLLVRLGWSEAPPPSLRN